MNDVEKRFMLDLSLRNDLTTFIHRCFTTVSPAQNYLHNWHVEALAWHLAQCAEGKIKRLLITLPPRYLKSICASVAFPAWQLGRDPGSRIIAASYSSELAGKHAMDCRRVMESAWYRRAFPRTRMGGRNRELDFTTTAGGYRYSTSVGGTLTGRGGNIIIVDDPIKPEDAMSQAARSTVNDWYDGTLYTRLDDKGEDVIIVIMQRVHLEDLAGHVLVKGEPWVHLDLPVIAEHEQRIEVGPDRVYVRQPGDLLHPAREPQSVIDQIKGRLGNYNFSAQYQQCPIPIQGEIIKWEWFKAYDELPVRETGNTIVQSWDTACRSGDQNNYSVCTTWFVKGGHYYLLDIFRDRLTFPDLRRRIIVLAHEHSADVVLIEDRSSGIALLDDLRRDDSAAVDLIGIEPDGDKVTRMHTESPAIQSGRVHLPNRAAWLDDFRRELMQFPRGRYDDQVDSLSQFLNWAAETGGGTANIITWI